MSAANCLLTEDQFRCSICLDVFTNPVTIPCGHNFCKTCITRYGATSNECPNCRGVFYQRLELRVNTVLSEMAAQFKKSSKQNARSSLKQKAPDDTGAILLACLVCLICVLIAWMVLGHGNHDALEYINPELVKTEAEIQQMIQARRLKIQETEHSVELSKRHADKELAQSVQVLTALKESVESNLMKVTDTVKEKQRKMETEAESFIRQLEQEISVLMKRSAEMDQPSIAQLKELISEEMQKQMKGLLAGAELKSVQRYAVDLTLDPDTAHPYLILSDDGKQVHHGDVQQDVPYNPGRFDTAPFVLAKQSFSSGRFYCEVEVKGKTDWFLGVAGESVSRRGRIILTPQNHFWTLCSWKEEYFALTGPAVRLSLQSGPEKVGVFVDYEEGLVSFYDVDAAALIYSFPGVSFTEKLYPFFSPYINDGGKNSAPLIISPVDHTG
ncbi:E3 ubiquitin-protein ligase TRIM21-like [Cheilinus undulatus]|uniref:E3 ubiquitin-protein ligase TRIM21-like n=1 Tax=Cheilinus undulatus TaxID=241271 RepID=UPI001BD211A0|nr:E3 ubiquitin-protein ligase TRIM21-like [Cheilinus undulatus]